jgi:metal-sulfur cluster biosynthetic enzyme
MELITFHDRIYGKYLKSLYVFEPTWDKDMMSEEAKLELGFL